jgi:hypothetical protein
MNIAPNTPDSTHRVSATARSPITVADFERMKQTVLFGGDDVRELRRSHDILKDQVEAILDVWYGFVGATPHLLASFTSPTDGKPIAEYLAGVRVRFGQWILDTARAEYDEGWLARQNEIGLRHHRTKKNRTDGVTSAAIVPFRDLFLLIFPVTLTLKPFLATTGGSAEDVEKMYLAWVKSCLLQVTLWSQPYVQEGDF